MRKVNFWLPWYQSGLLRRGRVPFCQVQQNVRRSDLRVNKSARMPRYWRMYPGPPILPLFPGTTRAVDKGWPAKKEGARCRTCFWRKHAAEVGRGQAWAPRSGVGGMWPPERRNRQREQPLVPHTVFLKTSPTRHSWRAANVKLSQKCHTQVHVLRGILIYSMTKDPTRNNGTRCNTHHKEKESVCHIANR
jgi:hypothetical protein